MNRRQFLSGMGAAFAGWLTRGVKVEQEPEQAAEVGRLSALTADNWGVSLPPATESVHLSFKHSETRFRYGWEVEKLTTRLGHEIRHHTDIDSDNLMIVARYKVKGEERVLCSEMWVSPEITEDEAMMDWALGRLDEEAEWCAAHPDEILTIGGAWT